MKKLFLIAIAVLSTICACVKQAGGNGDDGTANYLYKVKVGTTTGVMVNNGINGSVATSTGVRAGTNVSYSVSVTDAANYSFSHWKVVPNINGLNDSTKPGISFDMPKGLANGAVAVTITPVVKPVEPVESDD